MAHIRISHNDLEDKLKEARANYDREFEKALADRRSFDFKFRIVGGILGFPLTALLILLICRPELADAAKVWVLEGLRSAGEFLIASAIALPLPMESWPFLLRFIIGGALGIVLIAVGGVLGFLPYLLEPVVGVLVYLIPAITGLYFLYWCFHKEEPPTEEEMRFWFEVRWAQSEIDIIQAGLDGEKAALDHLRFLDDDCYVFTNLHIPYEGKESETDVIVVSPSGITIIEVKNHKGIIRGNASDHELKQLRSDEDEDEDEDNTFYNPIRQVATHAYRLAGYLRSRNLRTYVRTCVLFINPEARLQIRFDSNDGSEKCPVFHVSQMEKMDAYLYSGTEQFSKKNFDYAVRLLEELKR